MAKDPLQVVLRLRGMAVDAARADLASFQTRQQAAELAAAQALSRIAQEMAQASRIDVGDGVVEAFARWLPRGRADANRTRLVAERAVAECGVARSRLTAARAANEAVENALKQRVLQEDADAARQEQAIMDEVGLRTRPVPER
jgi:hypothetical protein